MKTTLTLATLCVATFARAFIYETPDEFSMELDFNGDGTKDLVLVDRANGQVTSGYGQTDGTFAWQEPKTSGVIGVAAVTFGNKINGTDNDIFLTAPNLNRAQYVRANLDTPKVQALIGVEHTMIIAVPEIPDEFIPSSGMLCSARAYTQPFFGAFVEGEQTMLSSLSFTNRKGPGIMTNWHGAHGNDLGLGHHYLWREDDPNGLESRVRLVKIVQGVSFPIFIETHVASIATQGITGAGADYVIEHSGSADTTEFWLFTWNRDGTSAHFHPVSLGASPSIGVQADFAMPLGIDSIVLIKRPSAAPQVAITLDHGALVKIYNFDGNSLTFDQNVTPENGRRASGIVPWKTGETGGGFTLLSREGSSGPSTHSTRYGRDANGNYQPLGTDALPKLSKLARSNVFLWQGEPMVQVDAQLKALRRAGDWTTSVSQSVDLVNATTESFVSSTQGLANPSMKTVGDSLFSADYVSGNQASASLSVFAYEAAVGAPSNNSIDFKPSPGRFQGAALDVTLSWTGRFQRVLYRTNGGAWQIGAEPSFIAANSFIVHLTTDTVVEAMLLSSITDGPGQPPGSMIFKAAYGLGPSPIPPNQGIDGNGNGLIDEWEKLFGVTNPTADDDGDGQSNFAEHNAGTDAHDATKFYTPPASLPVLNIGVAPSGEAGYCICARWSTDDPSVRLEYSTTLGLGANWLPVVNDITVEGSEYVFRTLPIPGEQARFFRLARY